MDTFVDSLGGVSESSESSLVDFSSTSWEDNESFDVLLESLDVSLKGLVGFIGSSGVDSDTDRSGVLLVDANGLDFLEGESSSLSDLTGISLGWLVNQRSEFGERSWENSGSLLLSLLESSLLLTSLIKEGSD